MENLPHFIGSCNSIINSLRSGGGNLTGVFSRSSHPLTKYPSVKHRGNKSTGSTGYVNTLNTSNVTTSSCSAPGRPPQKYEQRQNHSCGNLGRNYGRTQLIIHPIKQKNTNQPSGIERPRISKTHTRVKNNPDGKP